MSAPAHPPHTEISTTGEFGLIDRLQTIVENIRLEKTAQHSDLIAGMGDDAAVFRPPPAGMLQLLTTDALVEGVHFDLTFTSLRHLGWKAMAANLSDIAAMGGKPRYATVALSVPRKISIEMMEEFYRGMTAACKEYSFLIVGGDTTTSMANMTISIALVGEVKEKNLLRRDAARPGEYLCVTGHLGASIAGLKILQREKDRFLASRQNEFQPRLEQYALALEKHLMPRPRFDLIDTITDRAILVGGMIDISDGLASEVHHLCRQSNVGATLYEHNLPVESVTQHIAGELNESVTEYALYGGEEYELLFTISEKEQEKLEAVSKDITILGRITEPEAGIHFVRENGEQEPLPFAGWDNFRSR